MRQGPPVALPPAVPNEKTVRLVKRYDRPQFKNNAPLRDAAAELVIETTMLQMQVAELKDQRRRLREEITYTIDFLTAALEEGKEETEEQIRRRVSKLKGALEYRGRSDYNRE